MGPMASWHTRQAYGWLATLVSQLALALFFSTSIILRYIVITVVSEEHIKYFAK